MKILSQAFYFTSWLQILGRIEFWIKRLLHWAPGATTVRRFPCLLSHASGSWKKLIRPVELGVVHPSGWISNSFIQVITKLRAWWLLLQLYYKNIISRFVLNFIKANLFAESLTTPGLPCVLVGWTSHQKILEFVTLPIHFWKTTRYNKWYSPYSSTGIHLPVLCTRHDTIHRVGIKVSLNMRLLSYISTAVQFSVYTTYW